MTRSPAPFGCLLLALALAGCKRGSEPARSLAEPSAAVLPVLDAAPLPLFALRGRPVVLNFWATWCQPCVEEMPLLEAYARGHPATAVVAVSIDAEGVAVVRPFLAAHSVGLPVAVDTTGAVATAFGGIELLPTTVVLDAGGHEVARRVGRLRAGELEALVGRARATDAGA